MKSNLKIQLRISLVIFGMIVLVAIANKCYGQKLTDEQLDRRLREMQSEAYRGYTTEFNLMRLNFVNRKIQSFLSEVMDMSVTENSSNLSTIDSSMVLTESYHSKKLNETKKGLKFSFVVKAENQGHDFIIQSCRITGDRSSVLDFYLKYWKTTLDFENTKKEELVINHWINDRISLTWNDKEAYITVEKNS
jgi:hypothetical protein